MTLTHLKVQPHAQPGKPMPRYCNKQPAQWKDKATGKYSRRVKARTAAFLVPRNTIAGLRYAVIFVLVCSHFPQ